MAKAIATIGGTALVPGVSKNRRLYTRAVIAGAVARAQERIENGGLPLTMLTHHGAEDDSTRIVGAVRSVTLAEDGSARFTADIADTPHGRTIAALVDTSDGRPAYLGTVSIRGAWEGVVRRVTAPDGKPAETGDALELYGFDLTKDPGVSGARIDTFSWASGDQQETTERVLITESVREAQVTITGETTTDTAAAPAAAAPALDGVREALAVFLGAPVTEADGDTPPVSKRGSGMTGGGRKWADPGYQPDKKQRYDITTKAKALTAWRYINQARNAAKYSAAQLKQIKARIRAALKEFGVTVSTETAPGWGFEAPFQVSETVAELYGDPSRAGSWSVSASNGPVTLSLSSWSMDPADLDVILRAAAGAACKALAALDPDMDGDVDVPGVGAGSDPDGDAPPARRRAGTSTGPGDMKPADAGETQQGQEAPVTTEATTPQGGSAPSPAVPALDPAAFAAALAPAIGEAVTSGVTAAFAARDKAKKARAEQPATETAPPAAPAAPAAAGVSREALAEALRDLGISVPAPKPAAEADVTALARRMVQEMVASGEIVVARGGIAVVDEHTLVPTGEGDTGYTRDQLGKLSEDEFCDKAGAALDVHVFGGRTDSRGRPLAVHTTG